MKKVDKAYKQTEGFKRMIAQLAWDTWRMIPFQHQTWISVDDLVEDGMFTAYQMIMGNWYTKDKSTLITAIHHIVRNHLYNEYILRYGNEKRFATLESAGILTKQKRKGLTPAGVVSLDIPVDMEHVLIPQQLSTSEDTIIQNVLSDCFVVPVLGKIYREASSKLQGEMICWLLQNREKVHTHGTKFRRAAKEFRELSREYDLTYYDCLHIFRSPTCMNKLSHELLQLPYSMNYPAPSTDREL